MSNNNKRTLGEAPWLHVIISTGLGTGFFPFAPGTAGGLLALMIWLGLFSVLSPMLLFVATLLLVIGSYIIGVWTDNIMEKYWGEDPRAVVIDEFFGTWIALLSVTFVQGPKYLVISLAVISFGLFRLIDIFKPLGCRWIDKNIHGGVGCMLDDALAGFYALLITLIIRNVHFVEYLHNMFI